MLAPYSRPVGGFITLFPVMEVGNTLRQALYLTGVLMAAPRVCKAFGLIVSANGKSHGIRLVTKSISGARREAVKHSINGPVVLCMGASMGGKGGPIFRRLEQIEVMSPVQAVEHDDASIVASNGRLAEKAVNPRNYRDLEAISAKLARQLSAADRAWAQPFLKRYMNTFDVNWSKLTPTQFNTVFRGSRKFLSSLSTKGLLPVWDKHVTASVHGTALATRKILKREFFPKIGIAFSSPDKRALDQIAAQQGWFLRDEFGRRADALTAKGREIVQHGLRQGVGRDVIAQDLRKGLPGLWNAYGKTTPEQWPPWLSTGRGRSPRSKATSRLASTAWRFRPYRTRGQLTFAVGWTVKSSMCILRIRKSTQRPMSGHRRGSRLRAPS